MPCYAGKARRCDMTSGCHLERRRIFGEVGTRRVRSSAACSRYRSASDSSTTHKHRATSASCWPLEKQSFLARYRRHPNRKWRAAESLVSHCFLFADAARVWKTLAVDKVCYRKSVYRRRRLWTTGKSGSGESGHYPTSDVRDSAIGRLDRRTNQ